MAKEPDILRRMVAELFEAGDAMRPNDGCGIVHGGTGQDCLDFLLAAESPFGKSRCRILANGGTTGLLQRGDVGGRFTLHSEFDGNVADGKYDVNRLACGRRKTGGEFGGCG